MSEWLFDIFGKTMLATMQGLGVIASRSRPSVGNDNPHAEALFRTLKYRPELPILDASMLKSREVVYAAARTANPGRWSGATRNGRCIEEVHLNPTRAPNKGSLTPPPKQPK